MVKLVTHPFDNNKSWLLPPQAVNMNFMLHNKLNCGVSQTEIRKPFVSKFKVSRIFVIESSE